ncbi:aminoglycoside phosphotransferase [Actinosynnema sp. ALI-1.44]|uniref:phosphotransferase family protein n=1 Tax=Actinosynnema sp. ALI-1.44 TaxID=1933779 RepID=UPI00097C9063|nr:phosphotransferase [Actinosynnema sp. ALI-1.44]ONI82821.1 aminoglycoside phosphotransferase [Actinosynnema sp. ALI-1.44]
MRTLPDNPHLDHLRRQAKDLLAGLRDIDPATSLSDAQASLARQYGFRTWTELKAEVDRGQGHADVAAPELAQLIATRFGLGDVAGPMRSLSRPTEVGRRWVVDTERGRFVPSTVDHVYPVTDGEDNTRFQEAAARAGVLLPHPVRSTGGAAQEPLGGNLWRVYHWMHSGPTLAAPVRATVTHQVGQILAALHALRFPAADICPWNAERLTTTSWPDVVRIAESKGADWSAALAAAIPTLVELESVGHGTSTSAPVLCHNNITPGNVRVGEGDQLVVTGWEHASGLPPEWEVAQALASWVVNPDGGINATGARALVAGYRANGGELPRVGLADFRGTAMGSLNYVFDQIQSALDAVGAEDRRFADRSVRHLLAHLPSTRTYAEIVRAVR